MDLYLRVDINIAAFMLLSVVFVIAGKNLDRRDRLNAIFLRTSFIVMLELLVEAATCVINKIQGPWWVALLSQILHICLFTAAPIITGSWFLFIYRWMNDLKNKPIAFKHKILIFMPAIINAAAVLLSPVFKFIFYIDQSNTYFRGELFWLSSVLIYGYIPASLILLIRKRKSVISEEFVPLAFLGILPLTGAVFQGVFYGVLLMWSMSAFSLVIVYSFLQKRMVQLDKMTGTWTRSSFDYYILRRIGSVKAEQGFAGGNKDDDSDRTFGVIFIDLDKLKSINDEFGHAEGDAAIRNSALIIKNSVGERDIVARFGGDEFVIVANVNTPGKLDEVLQNISKGFSEYNSRNDIKYKLFFSAGAGIFDPERHEIEQFLHHVDSLMYNAKRAKTDEG